MEQRLIGREAELKLLNEYINSDKSEHSNSIRNLLYSSEPQHSPLGV